MSFAFAMPLFSLLLTASSPVRSGAPVSRLGDSSNRHQAYATPSPQFTSTPPAGYNLEKLSDRELGLVAPDRKAAILPGCIKATDIQAWTTDGYPVIKGTVRGPFDLGGGSAEGLWHRLGDPRLQLPRCPG